jgi:hypothetical protein
MAPARTFSAIPTAATPISNCENLINEHEAAARLGLKVSTMRRWRWAGTGVPFVRIGSAIRYDPRDLEAFIAAGRRKSTSDPGPAVSIATTADMRKADK